MRPISLTLENFTCFRDLQPTIEFSEMELFAITGPTGAGKSSILDGMVFALFGEVPRLGKQGLSELISLGRSRMVATLDFEVRGERWRIVRKVKRKGQSEVQLDKSEGSAYRVVASSVREVEKQVSRILGLTYDAFVQAVVLPQGEFAKFLKSPGKERRTILKDLLRMQLLDRMQKQATDSARACSVEVSGLDQRLSEDFLNATPEAVTARETLLAQLTAELLVLLEKSAAAAAAAEKARQDRKSTESLEAREARWEILNGEAPRVEADRARLEAARQAATVSPHLDAMRLAERTAGESARALKEAAATEEKLQAALSAALEIARQASAEAEQGPALRERIELLNRVIPIAERLHAHDAKISEMSEKMAALDAQIKARAADHAAAEKIHADAEAQVKKQQAAVAAVAYDAERDALVSPCRDLAVRLRGERAQAAQARAEATAAEKSAEAAREKADALRALAADAEKRRDEARKAHEDAAEVERDGRRQDMAQAVRHELVVGEACPACEIPVKKIPPMPKSAIDLKALDRATKAAAAVARGAEQEAAGAVDVASKAEGVADTALRHAGWAREKADALENSVSALQTQLKAGAGTEDEEMLLAELDALAKAKARHEAAARKCDEAVKARDAAQRKLPEHKTAVELASRDRDQQHSMLEDRRSEREQDARKIAAVTAGEPERERAEAVAQGDRLEKALAAAERASSEATAAAEGARQMLAACANTAERDAAQAEDRRGALRGALAEAEFPDEASATAALLSAPEIKRLAQAVDAHDKEFAQVSRDVSELTRELDGKRVTAETLDHLEGVASERQAAHHDALSRHAAGEKELERLKEDVAHVAEIRAQLKEARDRWNIQRQLADDLRNDRFQAWVLEEILHSIVRGASERLAGLTNRYALEMHNDDFYVIDNDNAGERRIAHTLSGGETFLTSLALALELSEQVQANAGAVRLDSLFIDEGFGTLDAETLDTVAGVLESLTVGGRMVGIITHISELSQRLPARLRVQKGAEGTKILAEA